MLRKLNFGQLFARWHHCATIVQKTIGTFSVPSTSSEEKTIRIRIGTPGTYPRTVSGVSVQQVLAGRARTGLKRKPRRREEKAKEVEGEKEDANWSGL